MESAVGCPNRLTGGAVREESWVQTALVDDSRAKCVWLCMDVCERGIISWKGQVYIGESKELLALEVHPLTPDQFAEGLRSALAWVSDATMSIVSPF